MDLPVIEPPIFPRWVWIEEITYSHIPIATTITAFMVLAPIYEYIGLRRNDPRWDRLARSLIWFALILFSPGAALGTGIPMWIMGTYPEFWSRWANIFFWPLMAQFVFFLLEVFFLFFFYYLMWDVLANRKRLHIFFGAVAAFWGVLVQFVWDSVGGYMLTPGGAKLPGVDEPVGFSLEGFFNPSQPFLFTHRFIGNISYTMLLVGGVFALKWLGQKDPKEKAYFGWASNLTFTLGFLFFFGMPIIGWFYARVIQREAPVAFHAIMGGHTSWVFTAKMALIATFLAIGGTYVFLRYKSKALLWGVTAGGAMLWVILTVHTPLKWLPGGPWVWRAAYTLVLAGFVTFLWLRRGKGDLETRRWKWAMFVAGLAAFFAFCFGGFVREASKNPQTVYGEIEKPEATDFERGRFFFYQTCVACHHQTVNEFQRYAGPKSWEELVRDSDHREMFDDLSEEEQQRLLDYLAEGAR